MHRYSNNPMRMRDDANPLVVVRENVTAAESVNLDGTVVENGTINPIPVNDWPGIGLRIVALGADGATFGLTIVGFYHRQTTEQAGVKWGVPSGNILYEATFTLGTETESNRHPIKGIPSTGITWRYPDTVAASTADGTTDGAGTTVKIYNAGAQNRRAWLAFDPLNYASFWVYLSTLGTITRLDVGAFGVG